VTYPSKDGFTGWLAVEIGKVYEVPKCVKGGVQCKSSVACVSVFLCL